MAKKDITIAILVLIVLILGYYTFSQRQELENLSNNASLEVKNSTENYFSNNQKCLGYKNEVASRLKEKDSSFGSASLEQIFYSPKEDSCLYVEYSEELGDTMKGERFYSRRLFDILDDGVSSKPLEYCDSFKIGDEAACKKFDQILEDYK